MAKKNQSKTKSLSKIQIIISAIFIVLLVGTTYYFYGPGIDRASEEPPTLSLGPGSIKGYIEDAQGFYQYTEEDLENFIEPQGESTALEAGLHFFYHTEDKSISDIMDSIEPVANNKVLIAFYSPESKNGMQTGFYTYPKGPFNTTYEVENKDSFIIPAYRGFIIIAKKETRIWGAKTEKDHINIGGDNPFDTIYKFFDETETGWVQFPATENLQTYINNLDVVSRIKYLYVQDGENSFRKIDNSSYPGMFFVSFPEGYYMVWAKIKPATIPQDCSHCSGCTGCSGCGENCHGIGPQCIGCTGCTGCPGCGGPPPCISSPTGSYTYPTGYRGSSSQPPADYRSGSTTQSQTTTSECNGCTLCSNCYNCYTCEDGNCDECNNCYECNNTGDCTGVIDICSDCFSCIGCSSGQYYYSCDSCTGCDKCFMES